MNQILEDIGTWLQAEGEGVLGDTIKLSQLAEAPDTQVALALYNAGGGLEAMTMSNTLYMIVPRLQFMVRAPRYTDAVNKATSIFNKLLSLSATTLSPSGDLYTMVQPLDTPGMYQRDGKSRVTFVFNAAVYKEQ